MHMRDKGPTAWNFLISVMLGLMIGAAPAMAAVEQCRFIQAKPEREACYQRQAIALAAKRKPERARCGHQGAGVAAADETGRRRGLQKPARHLPGMLSGFRRRISAVHDAAILPTHAANASRISFMTSRSLRPERAGTWKE